MIDERPSRGGEVGLCPDVRSSAIGPIPNSRLRRHVEPPRDAGLPYDAGMPPRTIDDATRQHLAEIAADILPLLGPGVELTDLGFEREGHGVAVLRAAYRMGSVAAASSGRGETIIEAHARLRDAIVEDRIGLALQGMLSGPSPLPRRNIRKRAPGRSSPGRNAY